MARESFRLGTRGSALAREQAERVRAELAGQRTDVEIVEVSTAGDRIRDELIQDLGRTGAFVRDLDERVLDGELDAAVHSLKDMPTDMPEDLVVAAIPERIVPNDVLVTPDGDGIEELPEGATVGTASLRRGAQFLAKRADLTIEPVRGNVDTRLEKLLGPHLRETREQFEEEDEITAWENELTPLERDALDREHDQRLDALVLAEAGLDRLGLLSAVGTTRLSIDDFVPAPGQGAIAVTMRDTDRAADVHRRLDHPPTRVAATVERVLLRELGGGCIAPVGIHAVVQGEVVHTRVQVFNREGTERVEATHDLPVEEHVEAAQDLAAELEAEGAVALIEAAAEDPD